MSEKTLNDLNEVTLIAGVVLKATSKLRELSEGILHRKAGTDRAARLALLQSTDYVAYVATLSVDGLIPPDEDQALRHFYPIYDCDHDQLLGLHEARQQTLALVAGGLLSPFFNMDAPKKWPAEERAEKLLEALKALVDVADVAVGMWEYDRATKADEFADLWAVVNAAKAAIADAEGTS